MLYKRGKIWWTKFKHEGKEFRRSCKTDNKRDAHKIAANIRAGIQSKEESGGKDEEPETLLTVTEAVDKWTDELMRRGRVADYIADVLSTLTRLFDAMEVKEIEKVKSEDVERSLEIFSSSSTRRRNCALGYLRTLFKWLKKTGRATHNPALGVEMVREVKERMERRALTPEELHKLLTCPEVHESHRVVYMVAAYTGLRRSELSKLRHKDIDFERKEVTIPADAAKNRKKATLPLAENVVKAWKKWLKNPIYPSHGSGPGALRKTRKPLPPPPKIHGWGLDLKRAGIVGVDEKGRVVLEDKRGRLDFHALRVTFGTNLARAGVPLGLAQELMRHSTPELTSRVYMKFEGKDKRGAIDRLKALLDKDAEKETPIEVRRIEGRIDEIVAKGVDVHFEDLGNGCFSVEISGSGKVFRGSFVADRDGLILIESGCRGRSKNLP